LPGLLPQNLKGIGFLPAGAAGGPDSDLTGLPGDEGRKDRFLQGPPQIPIPKKPADGYGQELFHFRALFRVPFQRSQERFRPPESAVLQVPAKALLHALADPAVTLPGKAEKIENPAELGIIHKKKRWAKRGTIYGRILERAN